MPVATAHLANPLRIRHSFGSEAFAGFTMASTFWSVMLPRINSIRQLLMPTDKTHGYLRNLTIAQTVSRNLTIAQTVSRNLTIAQTVSRNLTIAALMTCSDDVF